MRVTQSGRQGQPRWAWWFVGIVIPVLGLVVTLYVSTSARSDGVDPPPKTGETANGVGGKEKQGTAEGETSKKVFGPRELTFDFKQDSGFHVELDVGEPMLLQDDQGADLAVSNGAARWKYLRLAGPRYEDVLAPLPASASAAGKDCQRALERNLTDLLEGVTPGQRACIATSEGRVALMEVVSAPVGGSRLKVNFTVWESP
ncbi:hypothetical protein OG897_36380 [Streptomyces sp. NBC_00237]|uniref:hypothetical protein n=1 Tax=Streptomyces sp. NBC_00237 TaxID=2975687 RepID=UPI00225B7F47|nr:hypothetical protein [Streptomyces sp. NBC_00237]MCX5206865.1 hypothetical protein [Streptomyces sp. NBC_00237]